MGTIHGPPPGVAASGDTFRPTLSIATADAAANRIAIQAGIDLAHAYYLANGRPGTVLLDSPATYPFNFSANANPGDASVGQTGTKYTWLVTSGVVVRAVPGVRLRLSSNQMTGTTAYGHGFIFMDASNVTFDGGSTQDFGTDGAVLDMNSTNQSGWTGGYEQNFGGGFRAYGVNSDIEVKGWRVENTFGSPCNLAGNPGAVRMFIRDCTANVFGEGMQMSGTSTSGMERVRQYDTLGTSKGDGYEFAASTESWLRDCQVFGKVGNTGMGQVVDLFCSTDGTASGIYAQDAGAIFAANDYLGVRPRRSLLADSTFLRCLDGIYGPSTVLTCSNLRLTSCGNGGYALYAGDPTSQVLADGPLMRVYDCVLDDVGMSYVGQSAILELNRTHIRTRNRHGIRIANDGPGKQPQLIIYGGSVRAGDGTAYASSINIVTNNSAFAPIIKIYGCDLRGSSSLSFTVDGTGFSNANVSVSADTLYDGSLPANT